jgi:hypothetical protein
VHVAAGHRPSATWFLQIDWQATRAQGVIEPTCAKRMSGAKVTPRSAETPSA